MLLSAFFGQEAGDYERKAIYVLLFFRYICLQPQNWRFNEKVFLFTNLWGMLSKVDVPLQKLAHHITLPLDDTISFKDPMDRKIDTNVKSI